MADNYVKRILNANIYDLVEETPVDFAPLLSARLDNRVMLKREDLQPVFSFKLRGAYNRLLKLTAEQRKKGVVAASAGNHAQGLAMAAHHLGVPARIVMPRTTPTIKIEAVRRLGGKVVLHGDDYDSAAAHAEQLAAKHGLTSIHPFDDPDVIAGQGTVAMELLRQVAEPIDAIFVPVGGGGLCAGMAVYCKYLQPHIKIIAVEPDEAACLQAAMTSGRRVKLKQVGIFTDGAAVAQIGKETFRLLRNSVDQVITVSTDEVCAAIKDIFEDTRSIAEPAGALAVAGMKKYVAQHQSRQQNLVAINSGANMNFDRLRYISERTDIGEKREAIFAVTIPEVPGSFRKFCSLLSGRMITEFNYRIASRKQAHIFVGIQVASDVERKQVFAQLVEKGYSVHDLTDDEMAKLHIRHMVGGRSQTVQNERVFRIEFPERPGALLRFLNHMGSTWNISMFHYRNHGAAFGRVLTGLEIPAADSRQFENKLAELGYAYVEETDNPAYRIFLG